MGIICQRSGKQTCSDKTSNAPKLTEKKGKLNFRGNEISFRLIPFTRFDFSVQKIHDTNMQGIMYVYLQKTDFAQKDKYF